ncbi:peptide ABC transporter substrate-binding protein [Actinosynnema sp. ALI-1.44]|uniref:peptide ABC transporter substrate-binding protein n=1 Tax=Actinosynnema sp. ALI-1.44 TaxID=1933779 RepID=UPI00097C662F|nr:ABC transporter substrate-binding protein [Actinosynnema sp. ALI-1.44]ONI77735.1 peptide ABC transporter substrate-binding protein [Actinosynnema sp. ALI-1.44]
MGTRAGALTAAPLALVLVLSGCGGGGGGAPTGNNATADATITIYGTNPPGNMLPANATDAGSAKMQEGVYSQLIGYAPTDGKPFNQVAESITTTDSKVYNVKLRKGWKFHDGTEVKAKNFVDAWNWGAYGPNAQLSATWFKQIDGFDDVYTKDPDGPSGPQKPATPSSKTMKGLKVIGEHEFEIALKAPFSVFTTLIGYTPFAPLPDKFFADPVAFAKAPVGNGPLKFVSFTPNVDIKLTRNDDFPLEQKKVKFKNLTIKIYSQQEAAYKDLLSGQLDFMEALPPSAKAGSKYKTELGDRLLTARLLSISTLTVPEYLPEYKNLDLRKAIALAINRDQITKTVLADTYVPADGWVNDNIEGYEKGVCGEFCQYDAVKAREYYQRSGHTGKITIQSNADGGRKEPLEAACNSIKNAIGVECTFVGATNFGDFRNLIDGRKLTGLGRSDWGADYAEIENFLNPLYRTGGSSNDSKTSNPQLDSLLAQADATAQRADAIKLYQQAHHLLPTYFPSIPVWMERGVGAKSTNLEAAQLNFKRRLEYASVVVKAKG